MNQTGHLERFDRGHKYIAAAVDAFCTRVNRGAVEVSSSDPKILQRELKESAGTRFLERHRNRRNTLLAAIPGPSSVSNAESKTLPAGANKVTPTRQTLTYYPVKQQVRVEESGLDRFSEQTK